MKTLLFFLCLATAAMPLQAGPGHDHPNEPGAGGAMASGPVVITEAQAANLGLAAIPFSPYWFNS